MPTLLDGREVARSLKDSLRARVDVLKEAGVEPKLVVLLVGADPASQVYVGHKEKACKAVGVTSEVLRLPAETTQEELMATVEQLNADESVHGFIVQLPLPGDLDGDAVIAAIAPEKDVDGFHSFNMGRMVQNKDWEDLACCTPKGVTRILDHYDIDVSGMDAVVIGRSNIVGKPMANMLINRSATVTVCHSRTKDLKRYTSEADLVVVAVGRPRFLKGDMIKEGAIVIDVGIHRDENGLCGDVDFDAVAEKASAITPVPGGVGPMTVACLLENTVSAAEKRLSPKNGSTQ